MLLGILLGFVIPALTTFALIGFCSFVNQLEEVRRQANLALLDEVAHQSEGDDK